MKVLFNLEQSQILKLQQQHAYLSISSHGYHDNYHHSHLCQWDHVTDESVTWHLLTINIYLQFTLYGQLSRSRDVERGIHNLTTILLMFNTGASRERDWDRFNLLINLKNLSQLCDLSQERGGSTCGGRGVVELIYQRFAGCIFYQTHKSRDIITWHG